MGEVADAAATAKTSREAAGAGGGGAEPVCGAQLKAEQGPEESYQGGPGGSLSV